MLIMSGGFSRWAYVRFKICGLLTLWLLSITPNAQAIDLTQGDPAPDFTALSIEGETVTLSEFRGSPVFVAFWSSWCSRCKEELEFLKQLHGRYPTVEFLAINSESETPDQEILNGIKKAVHDWGIPFTVLVDNGLRIWGLYGIQALPTSFLIDPDGKIFFVEPNFYFASAENFENALHDLLEPKLRYTSSTLPAE